ncbi:MAG: hypothetical protein PHW53_00560 [Patescibacteria group bacterium]|nr:hypothetical protein [Patescibacteria group bacterium]
MPEGYPRTPEESVDVLASAKAAGEKERQESKTPGTPEESVDVLARAKESGEKEREEKEAAGESNKEKKQRAKAEEKAVEEGVAKVKKQIEALPVRENDAEQRFDKAEEKKVRKDIKRGSVISGYGKGLAAAPFIAAGVLIYGAYKVIKATIWDHWLKKYLGGIADILETGKKK